MKKSEKYKNVEFLKNVPLILNYIQPAGMPPITREINNTFYNAQNTPAILNYRPTTRMINL